MRKTLIPSVVAAALVGLCMSASAVVEEEDSEALDKEIDQRYDAIKAELETGSVADWAGEYGYGDGLGVNVGLALAPDHGFAYRWTGCLGVYGQNYGSVSDRNGRLVLDHVHPNKPGSFGGFSKILVPVPWGDRLYLVGEEQLGDFVNAVNSGSEPCSDMCTSFLLRADDRKAKVTGQPTLPAEYAARLLDKPLYARVTKIIEGDQMAVDDEYHDRSATVELDVGRNGGLWEGMEFYATTGDLMTDTFTVVKVAESSSVASVQSYDDSLLAPKRGLCVSTRFNDHASKGCKEVSVAGR
jgi:hypothetical protein